MKKINKTEPTIDTFTITMNEHPSTSLSGIYVPRSKLEVLEKENQKLKELLVRAGDYLPEWLTPVDILAEIDKLKEES